MNDRMDVQHAPFVILSEAKDLVVEALDCWGEILHFVHFVQNDRFGVSLAIFMPCRGISEMASLSYVTEFISNSAAQAYQKRDDCSQQADPHAE